MKKILKKIKDFVIENKKEPWFRYVAIITVLLIIAFGVSQWREWQDKQETESAGIVLTDDNEKEEENNAVKLFFKENRLHIVMFGSLTVLLGVVKRRNAVRLRESGGNIKE